MKHYDNFISLGYFCSVALELERIGLRSTSSPFDWCISDFDGVISAINNHFDGFLDYDLLNQSTLKRSRYFNSRYKVWFIHDFDQYHTLKDQLPLVAAKYERRIDRFYDNISRPTLFIRYISDEVINHEGKSAELDYIEKYNDSIITLLKSFNRENEIIYLANRGVESNIINIYQVDKDENDIVARNPFEKNKELNKLLMSIEYEHRSTNIQIYNKMIKKKKNPMIILADKLKYNTIRFFSHIYIHEKQI